MWFFQERMLFFPRRWTPAPHPRANVEGEHRRADGVKLRGWLEGATGRRAARHLLRR